VALAIITARSAIIDIPRGSLASDVARGCRPVFLNTLFPSRFPPAAAAAVAAHTHAFQYCCCCVAVLADWLGRESKLLGKVLMVAS
jgi:hypothetical protein